MRRALASFLLALLSFPLIAPTLFARTAADLPSCCRRNGRHNCAAADLADQPARQGVKAIQPKCPFFPKANVVPANSNATLLSVVPRVGATHLFSLTGARPDHHRSGIALRGSIRKRGPPTSF